MSAISMRFGEIMSKVGLLLAKLILDLWKGLNWVWQKMAPIRIQVNLFWLWLKRRLQPIWRPIDPHYQRLTARFREFEEARQFERSTIAIGVGFIYSFLILTVTILIMTLEAISTTFWLKSMIGLVLLFVSLIGFSGLGYTLFKEYMKGGGLFKVSALFLFLISWPAIFISFGFFLWIFILSFLGMFIGILTEGCVSSEAFDYSVWDKELSRPISAISKHEMKKIEGRYDYQKEAFEKAVAHVSKDDISWRKKKKKKKTKEDVAWESKKEDLAWEEKRENVAWDGEEREEVAWTEGEETPDAEWEESGRRGTEWEETVVAADSGDEMDWDDDEGEEEGVAWGDDDEKVSLQKKGDIAWEDEEAEILPLDEPTIRTVDKNKIDPQMPEEAFDL